MIPTTLLYYGPRDLDYARVRAAVRGSRRPDLTLYRVVDLRQAMANGLVSPTAVSFVSPQMSPSALLNLLDYGRISGDGGPVYILKHATDDSQSKAPSCLGVAGYLSCRDISSRALEGWVDTALGRGVVGWARRQIKAALDSTNPALFAITA